MPPGRFDLDVAVVGEQRLEPLLLFVGEQVATVWRVRAGPGRADRSRGGGGRG
jgi:hypothetical protein